MNLLDSPPQPYPGSLANRIGLASQSHTIQIRNGSNAPLTNLAQALGIVSDTFARAAKVASYPPLKIKLGYFSRPTRFQKIQKLLTIFLRLIIILRFCLLSPQSWPPEVARLPPPLSPFKFSVLDCLHLEFSNALGIVPDTFARAAKVASYVKGELIWTR